MVVAKCKRHNSYKFAMSIRPKQLTLTGRWEVRGYSMRAGRVFILFFSQRWANIKLNHFIMRLLLLHARTRKVWLLPSLIKLVRYCHWTWFIYHELDHRGFVSTCITLESFYLNYFPIDWEISWSTCCSRMPWLVYYFGVIIRTNIGSAPAYFSCLKTFI